MDRNEVSYLLLEKHIRVRFEPYWIRGWIIYTNTTQQVDSAPPGPNYILQYVYCSFK